MTEGSTPRVGEGPEAGDTPASTDARVEVDAGQTGEDAGQTAEDAGQTAEDHLHEAAAPGHGDRPAEPVRRGVTLPVAVPVTVALVLGLAIGLILGWVIPRPGDTAEALGGQAVEDSATDGGVAAGGTQGPAAAGVLDPATPSGVAGGPDGTEELGGLVIGTQGPVVELFEDYVCPFCAQLEQASGASLRQSALDGEFRLVLHPIAFLTEDSPRASNASACVYQHEEQEVWVAFHEGLYARQDPSEAAGQYTTEILLQLADEVGATSDDTTACIEDGGFDAWVAELTQQSFSRGVRGTPTLAVDGTLTDVAPLVQQ